jgi:acetolactate synthase-1/2/3 large subunit
MVRQLEGAIPTAATVVSDAPTLGYWLAAFWPATSPQSFLVTGFGSLGFGLPAALGVRLARPTRPVLALCGDGGLLFTGQELATAVHENLPVVILLVNDQAYGSVRAIQERQYAGRVSQVRLTNPDFVAYAASFGFESIRASAPDQVTSALRTAFRTGRPSLVELPAAYDLPPLQ